MFWKISVALQVLLQYYLDMEQTALDRNNVGLKSRMEQTL